MHAAILAQGQLDTNMQLRSVTCSLKAAGKSSTFFHTRSILPQSQIFHPFIPNMSSLSFIPTTAAPSHQKASQLTHTSTSVCPWQLSPNSLDQSWQENLCEDSSLPSLDHSQRTIFKLQMLTHSSTPVSPLSPISRQTPPHNLLLMSSPSFCVRLLFVHFG